MMSEFRACVVVPTYNNARTLSGVVEGLLSLGTPVIVVDDGATDGTRDVLTGLSARATHGALTVGRHVENRGKAAALLTGFGMAREAGFSHALTFDSDGQMSIADVPRLLDAARAEPGAYVLGYRRLDIPGYPAKNRLGRALSNGAIFLECGRRVEDSQCGLRVYPLDLPERARCRSGRFGFEAEILTRGAWLGYPFVQVPIECAYEVREGRVTHYRPGMDTWRGLRLHAGLLARSPWRRLRRAFGQR